MNENGASPSLRRPAERLAEFRQVNDTIARRTEEAGSAVFVCECGSDACLGTIALSAAEYERVRSNPSWAILSRGHELSDGGRRVREGADFLVVERLLLTEPDGQDEAYSA